MKKGLGQLETRLFAYIQLRKLTTVRTGELREPLHLTNTQERELLSRLERAGLIARVYRGLYLVPPRLPLGGKWSPDEALALNTLMAEKQGRYQICGPNAFHLYGFDEQIPARMYAYNNRLSVERQIGAVALTLIKVADARLGDTQEVCKPDGQVVVYASRTRTLVDAVYDWSRFNGLPRGYVWIRRELMARRTSAADLTKATLHYGDTGTIRRIGVLLEREKADHALLRKLEKALKPTTSLIPWIPTRPKRGTVNRRWGVVLNDQA
ncbi:MAG TPA: type IV toxin-antitoxin system AbiEi family antitoxin domain-containing protein [Sedimentisphaerales bacterium]|nr:type IV toxin-antitoxin system AbiEi family antitoxin domain-containing protein [Sedimentisphaerales bacterium]